MMYDQLLLIVADCTENHARILLTPRNSSGIVEISGTVRGPFSQFAKTLTADFRFNPTATGAFEALIVEPCYWTPHMPFSYELRLQLRFKDGAQREEVLRTGLRRLYCEGRNFHLESKRIVLRGLHFEGTTESSLILARDSEMALLVKDPTFDLCLDANRLGVPLIVDLSEHEPIDDETLLQLSWSQAVMLILLSVEQLKCKAIGSDCLRRCIVAAYVEDEMCEPDLECDAFAVQLTDGKRPSAWFATCNKPVVAIRNILKNEISRARAECDRMQAAFAPEFDLAGYFV